MKNKLFEITAKLLPLLIGTRGKNRLSILIYHRVLPEQDELFPNEVTKEVFDWQMEILARYFNPLPLSEALRLMDEDKLPERAVCVTFDDGYADNETVALPILSKWKIPATVFVASGYLNGGRMWNDSIIESIRSTRKDYLNLNQLGLECVNLRSVEEKRLAIQAILKEIKHMAQDQRESVVEQVCDELVSALPDDLMMSDRQVARLHAKGMTIGAHTVTHPIMKNLDLSLVIEEVEQNRQDLEAIIGDKVTTFAYPNGKPGQDYSKDQRDVVQKLGFECAVSTQWGAVSKGSDRWQLPRFTPWDRTPFRFLIRLLCNYRHVN